MRDTPKAWVLERRIRVSESKPMSHITGSLNNSMKTSTTIDVG